MIENLQPLPYRNLKEEGLFQFVLAVTVSAEHIDAPEDYMLRIERLKRLLMVIPEEEREDRQEVEQCIGHLKEN